MTDYLGQGLSAGARHYRAYVGKPGKYGLEGANTFSFMVHIGLRQNHTLLDVGCGSLRAGRFFIPYLNHGNYHGIEPNIWLVKEGIENETGRDQVGIKKPKFYEGASVAVLPKELLFDFVVARSIFIHGGLDIIDGWLAGINSRLKKPGTLAATFQFGSTDSDRVGWDYPSCVKYRKDTIEKLAAKHSLGFEEISWEHPHKWVLFKKNG